MWQFTCQRGTYTEVQTKAKLTYSDSGESFAGGLQLCLYDLDVVCSPNPDYTEAIRLDYGFGDTVYVSENTLLDRNELASSGNTHFVATKVDSATFDSGFAAITDSGEFGYTWRGSGGCGTMQNVYYPNYPVSALEDPVKSVEHEQINWGDEVSYEISQFFPYVVDSNKASVITLTDSLDPAIDASSASVLVFADEKDVTSNWNVSVAGQTLSITAKDTSFVQGKYTFVVSAPVRLDADFSDYEVNDGYCLIPNQALVLVNTTQLESNTVTAGVTYSEIEVVKTSSNPSITEGNDCYSLSGAEYAIFSDEACTDQVGTLTTDESGYGKSNRLRAHSTLYIQEVKAPEGYLLDQTVYTVNTLPLETSEVQIEETPITDPADILVEKYDREIEGLYSMAA